MASWKARPKEVPPSGYVSSELKRLIRDHGRECHNMNADGFPFTLEVGGDEWLGWLRGVSDTWDPPTTDGEVEVRVLIDALEAGYVVEVDFT